MQEPSGFPEAHGHNGQYVRNSLQYLSLGNSATKTVLIHQLLPPFLFMLMTSVIPLFLETPGSLQVLSQLNKMVWWERKNCEGFVSEGFVIKKPKPKPKPTNPKTPYKIHNNIQQCFGEFCFILFYFTFFHLWRHIYAGTTWWDYPKNMLMRISQKYA